MRRASPIWSTPRAWMKCHYPDVFAAALLNSQPMGFYAPAQIVRDAQEHGVEVRPVDVNRSDWDCTLETRQPSQSERSSIPAMPIDEASDILHHACAAPRLAPDQRIFRRVRARRSKACAAAGFDSVRDLWLRTRLPPKALERLAHADAFSSLGLEPPRRALGGARAAARRRQGRPAAVRARRDAGARARCAICRRCCRASRWSRTIAICICR